MNVLESSRPLELVLEGRNVVLKKLPFFRSHLSRCLHFATISFLLLSETLQSARDMIVFSTRHNWQDWVSFEYGAVLLMIDQVNVWGVFLLFNFHTYGYI